MLKQVVHKNCWVNQWVFGVQNHIDGGSEGRRGSMN